MTRRTKAELEALVAALEGENAALKAGGVVDATVTDVVTPVAPHGVVLTHRRSRWWAVLSSTLIIIGLILTPIAVVSSWAKVQLSSTDQFVATFAPLADDPAVQSYVSDQVVAVIEEQVDIPAITADLFDGLAQLDLPPRAASALALLEAPAAAGVQNLVSTAVDRLVASDAFSDVWAQALRVSHRQLTATLQGDSNAALSISGGGELGVQLGPIIEEVKKRLVDQGFGFASNIPVVERTIVIATADAFTTAQLVYGLAIAVGTWLPFIALALLAAGVLVAKRKVRALVATSVALGVVMLILAAGYGIASIFFVASVSPGLMPSNAAEVIYNQVIELMRSTTTAMIVLAFTVALIAWFSGPFVPAVRLRGFVGSGLDSVRTAADRRGISTGGFGVFLYKQRVLVRVLIGVVAAAVLLLSRPLSGATIVWTAVLALLAVLVAELLQRRGLLADVDDDGEAPAAEPPAGDSPSGQDSVTEVLFSAEVTSDKSV
ncbi:hypothetical protein ASC66_03135 [Leifsonia sp. Root4]|uniref:hypothetical protein n=1 Tax=Leifsonia sp. Root4 TaxID=1736525 RepID=UPI0006FF5BD1|nr:hypothetical protein [Leifsonia sp. Root4]KQW07961.1 hypothetical protein ASC66_03135 [Leifsonia sp. Root4]